MPVRDWSARGVPAEAGMALVVAVYSAVKRHSVLPALLILGDMSIQGNVKSLRSLAEPLQVGMDNGARKALVPLENKRHFLEVCLLADDPRIVAPEVLNKDRDKWEASRDHKYVDKAQRRGKVGWSVGRDLELSPALAESIRLLPVPGGTE